MFVTSQVLAGDDSETNMRREVPPEEEEEALNLDAIWNFEAK